MRNNLIHKSTSIREVLKTINELLGKTLFVVDDDDCVLGTISDGDVRRFLIRDGQLTDEVNLAMETEFKFLIEDEFNLSDFKIIKSLGIKTIPILDAKKRIVHVLDLELQKSLLPLEAVIMAGGKGTRLRPMTLTTPKPLLKIGGKPIIEYNIDRLIEFGINKIYISINYLKDQIKDYFGDGSSKGIEIEYIEEVDITGTLGSATYINSFLTKNILVMNSDLLTNIDYEDLYNHHLKTGSEMTVATVPYKVAIPYGIVETDDVRIRSIVEKPTYTYYSNAGIYIINQTCLKEIPQKAFYNATDMIEKLIEEDRMVSNYPILSYWLDIGKPIDFDKANEDIKHIEF